MAILNVNDILGDVDLDIREDGVIDEDVEWAYSSGHCHSFALALHFATGMELVGCLWEEHDPDDIDGDPAGYRYKGQDGACLIPGHILCRDASERCWDIHGERVDEHVTGDVKPVPVDFVESACDGMYREADFWLAATFLNDWFDRYGRPE